MHFRLVLSTTLSLLFLVPPVSAHENTDAHLDLVILGDYTPHLPGPLSLPGAGTIRYHDGHGSLCCFWENPYPSSNPANYYFHPMQAPYDCVGTGTYTGDWLADTHTMALNCVRNGPGACNPDGQGCSPPAFTLSLSLTRLQNNILTCSGTANDSDGTAHSASCNGSWAITQVDTQFNVVQAQWDLDIRIT